MRSGQCVGRIVIAVENFQTIIDSHNITWRRKTFEWKLVLHIVHITCQLIVIATLHN